MSMFADPTITVNAVPQALKRNGMTTGKGSFRTADGLFVLTIGQSAGKNFQQSMIKLDRVQSVADPFTTGSFLQAPDTVWFATRGPSAGLLSVATRKQLFDGLSTFVNASSGAAWTQLLGGEI
nr:MAG: hypothetical protein 2 [Leviviridae sp.]